MDLKDLAVTLLNTIAQATMPKYTQANQFAAAQHYLLNTAAQGDVATITKVVTDPSDGCVVVQYTDANNNPDSWKPFPAQTYEEFNNLLFTQGV